MNTEYHDNNKTRFDSFDTWSEFVEHAHAVPSLLEYARRGSRNGSYEFTRTGTYTEAHTLACAGWREGVEQARKLSADIETRFYNVIERSTIQYDVAGEILDIGRFCAGEPEHWGVWHSQLVEGPGTKHIHIVTNAVCSGGIDAGVLMQRGSAVAALINLLELAGHRVKVTLVMSDAQSGYRYEYRIALKQFDETLDLDRIAFAIVHPSAFRRIGFSVMETLPQDYLDGLSIGFEYGRPVETAQDKGDLYMPMMMYGENRWKDGSTASKWVSEELVRLGVLKEGGN